VTEEEAKTKPCIGPAPHNTGWAPEPGLDGMFIYLCRASNCMAWRYRTYTETIVTQPTSTSA